MDLIANTDLSDLIGSIYDCAVDPDRWPETMALICEHLNCMQASIMMADLAESDHQFVKQWNADPVWQARHAEYNEAVTLFYRSMRNLPPASIDEPLVLRRDVPDEITLNSPYFREWVKPQGICDCLQSVVLQDAERLGVFAALRHESVGNATEREIAMLRLLAPHIRRAVTIGDMLDMKKIEADTLTETLDSLRTGVTLVGEDERILHTNAAAKRMIDAGTPVRAIRGNLSAQDPNARKELKRAITLARRNEAEIGAAGIGVPLRGVEAKLAIAHVLPLAGGRLRTRLAPQTTAAVFIIEAEIEQPLDSRTIAQTFGLTPMESKILDRILAGDSLVRAGINLGIAGTTARTHLTNIFGKTGVSRQQDLVALAYRLCPPIRASAGQGNR